MHVVPKHGVDGSLISFAMAAKKNKYIGIETQRDLLFLSRPTNGALEKIRTEFRALREINLRIPERINPFPVGPRPLFRIGCLPKQDDTNGLWSTFRKDHDGSAAANRADSNPAAFSVVFSHIGREEKDAAKHLFRIRQVETMFSNVLPVLVFIPFEPIGRRLFIDFQGHI